MLVLVLSLRPLRDRGEMKTTKNRSGSCLYSFPPFSRSRRLEFLNDLRDATLAGLAFKALADAASFRRFENSRNVEVSVRYKGAHFDVLRIIKT